MKIKSETGQAEMLIAPRDVPEPFKNLVEMLHGRAHMNHCGNAMLLRTGRNPLRAVLDLA